MRPWRREDGGTTADAADSPSVPDAPAQLGLVLGGGGARGLCHVGVLRVLEQLGIHPDVVSGTSMGGLVGAFVAAGYSAAELEDIATDLRWRRLIDWNPLSGRLLNTRGFEEWLTDLLPPTFEELELPLVLTATNLDDGRIYYARSGNLVRALRATTAYPGVIEPVRIGGDTLVDGGLLNQIPVDGALLHGVRRVLAVNATPLSQLDHPGEDAGALRQLRGGLTSFKELLRAADVMQAQLTMSRLSFYKPDVLIDPRVEGVEIGDFHKVRLAIEAGAEAALERAEELTRLFGGGLPGTVDGKAADAGGLKGPRLDGQGPGGEASDEAPAGGSEEEPAPPEEPRSGSGRSPRPRLRQRTPGAPTRRP